MSRESFKSCPRVGGIRLRSSRGFFGLSVSSRAPVWGASLIYPVFVLGTSVSSRAPVWGASFFNATFICARRSFKSCPRVGGIVDIRSGAIDYRFQVVPPCGGHRMRA